MQGVVMAARVGTRITDFLDIVQNRGWVVQLWHNDDLRIRSGENRVYIGQDDHLMGEYEGSEEILRVLALISTPVFFTLDFNDFDFAKEVLKLVADSDDVVVDNDRGDILRGSDFVRRMRNNPKWDWRRSQ